MPSPRNRRSIPSLDGLRAIAVALVVLSHLRVVPDFYALTSGYADALAPIGLLGVRIFFVISGFLITTLLLDEIGRSGTIRLRHFYFRRTLRIFPAFYVMLGVAAFLGVRGVLNTAGAHWWWLVSYTSNLGPAQPADIGHSWSLGVEEQFYLLWPAVLLLSGRRRALCIAVSVILLMPFARLIAFIGFHSTRLPFAAPYDFLAAGCALALANERLEACSRWRRLMAARWPMWLLPAVAVYSLGFAMSVRWRFAFDTLIGQSLIAIATATAIGWCVANAPRGLNRRPVRAVGVLSYSIYLYQEFWLRDNGIAWPLALGGILLSAIASHVLIERPFLGLRQSLEGWRIRYRERSTEFSPS